MRGFEMAVRMISLGYREADLKIHWARVRAYRMDDNAPAGHWPEPPHGIYDGSLVEYASNLLSVPKAERSPRDEAWLAQIRSACSEMGFAEKLFGHAEAHELLALPDDHVPESFA